MKSIGWLALLVAAIVGVGAMSVQASPLCTGNCGTLGANGVVTAPAGNYNWISTSGGIADPGLGVGGETNGSRLLSDPFSANPGDVLTFHFNYVTSDGSGFPDYTWARLLDSTLNPVALLFTARTEPSGDTSPGNGLPPNDATLTPATTPIIGGAPVWSPLGGSSGACWAAGCGYTGWIQSDYTILAAGNYILQFGVVNANDTAYDSGLAFYGAQVAGTPIPTGVPEPTTLALLAFGLAPLTLRLRNTIKSR